MHFPLKYSDFLKNHGIPLSQINPGSSEVALNRQDALEALATLNRTPTAISGGDVLRFSQGKLEYVYENWSCPRMENEKLDEFSERSQRAAKEYIESYSDVEKYDPLFVFVISK